MSSRSTSTTTESRSPTRHGPVAIPQHVAGRAIANHYFESPTGCHVSLYSVASHGYAQIGWHISGSPRRATTAHRAAWTAVYGQIPEGMTIDHMCRNRRCVNVEHLRMLSNFENARRTKGADWPLGAGECKNGHQASDYIYRSETSHTNGFCGSCFPRLRDRDSA